MDGMIAQNKGWALLRVKKVKATYDGPTKVFLCLAKYICVHSADIN